MSDLARNCWVISDGRRGIENQALGLAEAAARISPLDIQRHIIQNGKAFTAANPRLQFAIKPQPSDYGLPKNLPAIAIGCGRQAIAPLMSLKKAAPDIFTAYVQAPRVDPENFDVVFAPEHDSLTGPNVELMIGSPNRITNDLLIKQTLYFAKRLQNLKTPRFAMLIGGKSKAHHLSKADHDAHLNAARQALGQGYSVLITTSRRTPLDIVKDYQSFAKKNEAVWLFDGEGENPYHAFLGAADAIAVTEESTNMLTEACATGKPVFRLPMSGKAGKFNALYKSLSTRCHVERFSGKFTGNAYAPLAETERMATQFWAHFEARHAILN